jgi:hypothetical protein
MGLRDGEKEHVTAQEVVKKWRFAFMAAGFMVNRSGTNSMQSICQNGLNQRHNSSVAEATFTKQTQVRRGTELCLGGRNDVPVLLRFSYKHLQTVQGSVGHMYNNIFAWF